MEHSLLSASKLYSNITFRGLGLLLGLRPSAAESMARTMIQQRRLKASMDQLPGGGGLVVFEQEREGGDNVVSNVAQQLGAADEEGEGREEEGFGPATKRWDLGIRTTLGLAEGVAARCEVLLARGTRREVQVAA